MPLRIATGKQGVLWHGSFFVYHSLAHVNREMTLALLDTGRFDIGLCEHEPPAFSPDVDPRFAALAARARALPESPVVTVRHFWPPDFRRPDTPRFVLMQPWEFGSLPRAWVRGVAESVDEVWAYTHYVREVYLSSGVPAEKVKVVPLGVNTARFNPQAAPLSLPTSRSFKFLFVGGTIGRKGIDVLLDAYTRAFTAKDDVSLVIKDFGTRSFYAGQGVGALIAALQAKPDVPEIVYLTEDLTEEQVAGLYAACDCLVHPYRGEGYGLPIAEAMACGKPTVVTNVGAALDFARAENCYLLPATVTRLSEKRIGDLETVDYPWWAEPDREALAAILRRIYENPAEAQARGAQGAQDIAAGHTWAHAAQIAADRLEALMRVERPASGVRSSLPNTQHRAPNAYYEERKQGALAMTRSGDWNSAVEQIEACLAENPDDWDLINALAVARYRLGETESAKELLRRGIAEAPNARDFHHNLAFLLLGEGEALGALDHAAIAFEVTPDSPEIRRTLERAREETLRRARRLRRTSAARKEPKPQRRSTQHAARSTLPNLRSDERYRALMAAVARADALLSVTAQPSTEHRALDAARPRLSVVMIMKNEERFLRDCLESVREVADEIVIVDTGSTDRSVEIAQEYGAKVVHHAWNDDFSAARNISLENATGDWALWLDADERLAQGEGQLLRSLIETAAPGVGGYMVNIRNFMQMTENPEVCWHRACRLFRRLPGVRFTGRIHEQNVRALQEAGYTLALSKLTIDHYGYAASVMAERDKHARFIRMLTREVEENPDDAYRTFHLFNLGNAYYTFGDMASAAKWFEKAAENPDPTEEYTAMLFVEWATALHAMGRAEEALRVCDRAEGIGIFHPGLDFARGHAALHLQDYDSAEKHFRRAIERGQSGLFVQTGDTGAHSYKAVYGLALAMTGRDRYEEAARLCREALAEKEEFADARYLLANALRRLNRLPEARREFEALLSAAPDHPLASMDMALVLSDLEDYPAALPLLRRAAAARPDSVDLWMRLGLCCERLGLWEEARDAFLTAQRLAPRSPEAWVNVGRMHAALGAEDRAIDCYTEAIALNPQYANAYFNAADSLYRLGYYAKAAEVVCAGLQRDPANAAGFFVLGNCYFQTRDYAAAILAYREALARRPDYSDARSNLQLAEQMMSEEAKAA